MSPPVVDGVIDRLSGHHRTDYHRQLFTMVCAFDPVAA